MYFINLTIFISSDEELSLRISQVLQSISNIKIINANVSLNKDNPYNSKVICNLSPIEIKDKVVILVDDVIATGGTMNASENIVSNAGYDLLDKLVLIDIGIAENNVKSLIKY